MYSWVQPPAAHGYASPRTMKVRGLVQSMWSTSGQERPLVGGSGMDTGGCSSREVANSFHVPMNFSRVGMGWGNGRPVAAV